MPAPTVAVVVPVKDDPRLGVCLDALLSQEYPRLARIVVADNGSRTDVSSQLPDDPRLMVVSAPEGGSYAARNAALTLVREDVVAFTDSDCIPAPDWLAQGVRALGRGADVVAGRVEVFAQPGPLHPVAAYELVHAFPQERYVSRDGACVTANLLTTRDVLAAVGPFRSELRSGADVEWGQRASRRGFRVHYVHEAYVLHPARDSYAELRRKIERVIRGRWERDVLDGRAGESPRFTMSMLRPPFRAAARTKEVSRLNAPTDPVRLFIGETYARFVAARAYWRLRAEQRSAGR